MYNSIDKKIFDEVYHLLLEYGSGNLYVKKNTIVLGDEAYGIENLVARLKTTIAQVSNDFKHHGFTNQMDTICYGVQSFFLLDNDDKIEALSPSLKKLLFVDNINSKPFDYFLTDTSKLDWIRLKKKLAKEGETFTDKFIKISLKTKRGSIHSINCLVSQTISHIKPSAGLMITAISIEKNSDKRKKELFEKVKSKCKKKVNKAVMALPKKHQIVIKSSDIEKLKKVHKYIQSYAQKNLIKPLPPLKKIAKQFDLSENRVNAGFRQIYGQSLVSFFNMTQLAIRLEKGRQLIKFTKIPLGTIAITVGYKSLSNFTYAFKKEYHMSPSEVRYHKAEG